MSRTVRKTVSLPAELARALERRARLEGRSFSALVADALRTAGIAQRRRQLRGLQGYWAARARRLGILTERDLERCLEDNQG